MPVYVISIMFGYLIGSFPSAYFFVKRTKKLDIRNEGSGNVGAMNAFEVTNSKNIGVAVMLVDMLKGILSVGLICAMFGTENQQALALSGISVVVGHNYPIWLKFKGGRGLSTAAGVMVVLNWLCIIIWGGLWVVFYSFFKNVHKANIIATIVSPLVVILLPDTILSIFLRKRILSF